LSKSTSRTLIILSVLFHLIGRHFHVSSFSRQTADAVDARAAAVVPVCSPTSADMPDEEIGEENEVGQDPRVDAPAATGDGSYHEDESDAP
jgi:hypothetical protein